jgi:hypothetical protein
MKEKLMKALVKPVSVTAFLLILGASLSSWFHLLHTMTYIDLKYWWQVRDLSLWEIIFSIDSIIQHKDTFANPV